MRDYLPESIELDLDIEEENVGTQFIASSNGDESPTFPRDNPWVTVTEEETGTKPPLLSRLWQSHVRGQDDQTNDTTPLAPSPPVPANRTPSIHGTREQDTRKGCPYISRW